VRSLLGEDMPAREVIERYRDGQARAGRATHARAIAAALVTDFHFRAPAEGFARGPAAHGHPTWHYVLEWASADPVLEAYHGICTPLVFGTHEAARTVGPGESARRMSGTVQDAWLAFARCGAPSAPALDRWPRFDSERRATMLLNERSRVVEGYRQDELSLWSASLEGATR
jgi:para-nitrobenzyl esterase